MSFPPISFIPGLRDQACDAYIKRVVALPGELVSVKTRRGQISIKSREDRSVPENMIFVPFCFSEAAANILTNPQLDPLGKIPEFKFCAAKVEPVNKGAAAAE